jgi:hypothetical protein
MNWLDAARDCIPDPDNILRQSFLTHAFNLIVDIERLFHLDQMEDLGFALLSGGRRCPSRHTVGAWRRHLSWQAADAFCRRTNPWHLIRDNIALVSYDEHTIPRWTHKFQIPKGYITTRNKHMHCEKLFYAFDLGSQRYLSVRATPGDRGLMGLSVPLVQQTLDCGRPEHLHALFDAGAGQADAGVRALWDLTAEHHPRLDVTMRACRYPHRVKEWKQLPSGLFVSEQENGPYVGAPDKEIRLAETTTVLKDESADQAVRTVICREMVPGPKKDRWHPLFTTTEATPLDVLTMFRARQNHEQSYRVGVHDLNLDAVPCGYDKDSPDPNRPRFPRGPLQMMGWLVGLVYNAMADLAGELGKNWEGCHVRTIRRTFLNRPGLVYGTPTAVVVQLDPFAEQAALSSLIDRFNACGHRLPWLENRRLILSLSPKNRCGTYRLVS